MAENAKRKEVQPLKLPLSFVNSAAVCALHITFGQAEADLCFSMNESAFPVQCGCPQTCKAEGMFGPLEEGFSMLKLSELVVNQSNIPCTL